ncbi:PmoA family protein [Prolixibacteraceae bacterium Z1-6]|uniref:PmoA family protein n=1 Tax=Draconibacterium aestuarii TaxID=2998507 RepID=A0A9X3FE20_9BACT|nr:PmoA family protein [Prolixibacteraceae bacterium Z1-6]
MRLKLLIITLLLCHSLFAQELVKFKVQIQKDRIDAPVAVSLDGLNYNTDKGNLVLYEINKAGEMQIASQLEPGHSARLWFILKGESKKGSERKFVLKREEKAALAETIVSLKKDSKDLSLLVNEKPVLNYRFATTYPPDGVDPLYKRSGFIHPLWSPGGKILTRIQAPDHYHHYGIWGPWTKTHIDDRAVDFWNLKSGEGTVKFAGFLSEAEGAVYSGFKALQQHIDFGGLGEDQIAMNEILDVRAWNLGEGVWMVDYTTSLNSPLKNGIMLDAYRYGGGIGWRATEKWHKDNCTVLTSDNKTRVDADGSYARWCMVEGESEVKEGRSGILFLSHPSNRMHPEPMRVWPLDANNGRGDMYFEFVPIRHDDWKLEPKQNYTLKYRMIIFDGKLDAETAEKYWNSFAANPVIEFENK